MGCCSATPHTLLSSLQASLNILCPLLLLLFFSSSSSPLPPYYYPCSSYPPSSAEPSVHSPLSLFLLLFCSCHFHFIKQHNLPSTSDIKQPSTHLPTMRQHHKKNNSPQPIPLSMCLQGRTGARAFCRVGPPEERPDQPAEQATSQQQNMGIHHSGSAAAAVRGCLVPGAVQRRYACCARSHDQLQTQLPHAPTHR